MTCCELSITGLKGSFGRESMKAHGGYPVRLNVNSSSALNMRVGNTLGELVASSWLPYSSDLLWLLPASGPQGLVYVELEFAGAVTRHYVVAVPPYNEPEPGGLFYTYPARELSTLGESEIWRQDFADGADRWTSYFYLGGGDGHAFYPCSHEQTGGVGDGPYIWTGSSRWGIDKPEKPESVLALLIYSAWMNPVPDLDSLIYPTIDLLNTKASFYLRGNFNLNGGDAYFWVLDGNGRIHKTDQPLSIGNGTWEHNEVSMLPGIVGWSQSWGTPVDLSAIQSFGISFRGFSAKPTGRLEMSAPFTIAKLSAGF